MLGMLGFLLVLLLLYGCGREQSAPPDTEEPGPIEEAEPEPAVEIAPDTVEAAEPEPAEEAMPEAAPEPKTFYVENPSNAYYFEGEEPGTASGRIQLHQISERANEITDEERWLSENQLVRPWFPYADSWYEYVVSGDGGSNYEPYRLELYDMSGGGAATGNLLATLDFSEYCYAGAFKPEDELYIRQRICYAKAEEQILYAAIAHNTYAASAPCTAYVVAVDLSDGSVIWKTDPLTCNSKSFEIIGDVIVCGYGFTAEDDFLNLIDKHTGKLLEQIPVKTQPDYIIRVDDLLYVRTYNTDYVFQITDN